MAAFRVPAIMAPVSSLLDALVALLGVAGVAALAVSVVLAAISSLQDALVALLLAA